MYEENAHRARARRRRLRWTRKATPIAMRTSRAAMTPPATAALCFFAAADKAAAAAALALFEVGPSVADVEAGVEEDVREGTEKTVSVEEGTTTKEGVISAAEEVVATKDTVPMCVGVDASAREMGPSGTGKDENAVELFLLLAAVSGKVTDVVREAWGEEDDLLGGKSLLLSFTAAELEMAEVFAIDDADADSDADEDLSDSEDVVCVCVCKMPAGVDVD